MRSGYAARSRREGISGRRQLRDGAASVNSTMECTIRAVHHHLDPVVSTPNRLVGPRSLEAFVHERAESTVIFGPCAMWMSQRVVDGDIAGRAVRPAGRATLAVSREGDFDNGTGRRPEAWCTAQCSLSTDELGTGRGPQGRDVGRAMRLSLLARRQPPAARNALNVTGRPAKPPRR